MSTTIVAAPVRLAPVRNSSAVQFSLLREARQCFSARAGYLALWPLHRLQQRSLHQTAFFKQCYRLPHFPQLWRTIQKGSFAYNALLLNITPYSKGSAATAIADLTCLALLFGDECIDGLCQQTGKDFIQSLTGRNRKRFYLQSCIRDGRVWLQYNFNLHDLFPQAALDAVNDKYGISYRRFYTLLQDLLQQLTLSLQQLPLATGAAAAAKITEVCNGSFDTYLHDIGSAPLQDQPHQLTDLLHFHEAKNRTIQYRLLELRCLLAGKPEVMNDGAVEGWLDIISIMQYYDDMLDAAKDDGFQDNILLSIARQRFTEEWQWFQHHKHLLDKADSLPLLLSLHMPGSIQACLQLIQYKTAGMTWEQKKITDFLLRKNWISPTTANNIPSLYSLYHQLHAKMCATHTTQVIKAFAIDTAFHLPVVKQQLMARCGLSEQYRLRFDLGSLSNGVKARIFDTVTANACGV